MSNRTYYPPKRSSDPWKQYILGQLRQFKQSKIDPSQADPQLRRYEIELQDCQKQSALVREGSLDDAARARYAAEYVRRTLLPFHDQIKQLPPELSTSIHLRYLVNLKTVLARLPYCRLWRRARPSFRRSGKHLRRGPTSFRRFCALL